MKTVLTLAQARAAYPALMAYIEIETAGLAHDTSNPYSGFTPWVQVLKTHEEAADRGESWTDLVADQLTKAQADYEAAVKADGRDGYAYNGAMHQFLGLTNPEGDEWQETYGYYMASCIKGRVAHRRALAKFDALVASGAEIKVAVARDKLTGKPTRFSRFKGPDQIRYHNGIVILDNGGRKGYRFYDNWNAASTLQRAVVALRDGVDIEAAQRVHYENKRATMLHPYVA